MRNILTFTFISTLSILSSCMLPNNTTVIETKKGINTDEKLKEDFSQRVKNKKNEVVKDVNITINTELMDNIKATNNVFQVLSNTVMTRKKTFLAGEHATNNSHIRDKDINIFNPNDPQSLILSVA